MKIKYRRKYDKTMHFEYKMYLWCCNENGIEWTTWDNCNKKYSDQSNTDKLRDYINKPIRYCLKKCDSVNTCITMIRFKNSNYYRSDHED
jgi:hypothetical protein